MDRNIKSYGKIIELRSGADTRKILEITGRWSDDIIDEMLKCGVYYLTLNVADGWRCTDYSFLSKIPHIKGLQIIAETATNLEAVSDLASLEMLNLSVLTDSVIEFGALENLREVYLDWQPGYYKVFDSRNICDITLRDTKSTNISRMGNLKNLRSIELVNSEICELPHISPKLCKIVLSKCKKLKNIESIQQASNLQWLEIRECKKIEEITFIGNISGVSYLFLENMGEIENIEFVCRLKKLKALWLAGDTNVIDGNFGCLEALQELTMVAFAQRKHYSHKISRKWNWDNLEVPGDILKRT